MQPASTQDERERVRNSALASLTRREHSRAELQRKLLAKFYDDALVTETLDWLAELGYLNDERFAQMFVRSSVAKGRGRMRIALELRQKGVNDTLIDAALDSQEVDWSALAEQVLRRKFPHPPQDMKEKAKQARYLQYRGFDFEQFRHLL